jgi:hypothetical protein
MTFIDETWLNAVALIRKVEAKEVERLQSLLNRFDRKISAAFLDSVRRIADQINVAELSKLIAENRIDEAIALVDAKLIGDGYKPLGNEIAYSMTYSARDTAEAARDAVVLARTAFSFNSTETEVVDFIRAYQMDLIRELNADSLASVKAAVTEGVAAGRNPLDTARDVKRFIGLTESQTKAVQNFRSALENGRRDALDRALRDKRFDPSVLAAINGETQLSAAQIDKMVARYQERYLAYRAQNIAKTEALRALNGGAHLAWRQMVASNQVDGQAVTRRWHYTHDSKTRFNHRLIPDMNPDGVGLDQLFQTPDGPLLYPGDPAGAAHAVINCRCTVLYSVAGDPAE